MLLLSNSKSSLNAGLKSEKNPPNFKNTSKQYQVSYTKLLKKEKKIHQIRKKKISFTKEKMAAFRAWSLNSSTRWWKASRFRRKGTCHGSRWMGKKNIMSGQENGWKRDFIYNFQFLARWGFQPIWKKRVGQIGSDVSPSPGEKKNNCQSYAPHTFHMKA